MKNVLRILSGLAEPALLQLIVRVCRVLLTNHPKCKTKSLIHDNAAQNQPRFSLIGLTYLATLRQAHYHAAVFRVILLGPFPTGRLHVAVRGVGHESLKQRR